MLTDCAPEYHSLFFSDVFFRVFPEVHFCYWPVAVAATFQGLKKAKQTVFVHVTTTECAIKNNIMHGLLRVYSRFVLGVFFIFDSDYNIS